MIIGDASCGTEGACYVSKKNVWFGNKNQKKENTPQITPVCCLLNRIRDPHKCVTGVAVRCWTPLHFSYVLGTHDAFPLAPGESDTVLHKTKTAHKLH